MTRIASIRPVCRLAFENAGDRRGSLDGYMSYLLSKIEEASIDRPDIACLPEDCMMMMQAGHVETTEGVYFHAFRDAAAKHDILLSVGLVLSVNEQRHNATVFVGRDGTCLGWYEKTHLTLLEREKYGITPGDSLPIFDTDIGRVGVMTCSDVLFPEVARCLATKGAQLIIFPHQMAEPSEDFFSVMVRSRAQDSCVPVVCCNFADQADRHWYRNWIVAADGRIVAEGPLGEGHTIADLDLEAPVPLFDYIEPGDIDLRQIVAEYRRPELYQDLTLSNVSRRDPKNIEEAV